ncbi:MAG: MFS transporter, partial [Maricaulaceae bacterium]
GTRFGWLGAAMGVGFILGPAVGGLLGELTPRAPFFAAAALAAINALYGFIMVPESLKKENRRPFSWKRANSIGTLLQLRRTEGLGVLVIVALFSSLSSFVYPAVWSYVAIGKFGWSEAEIGYSIAFYGLMFAISQAGMIPLLLPRLGARRAIWISLAVEAVALVGIAFAPNGLTVYVLIVAALITGLQGPALQKVMTERVGPDAQGELQGGLSALNGVTLILAPLVYTQMFFAFERGLVGVRFPGAPFLLAAAMAGVALVLFLARRHQTSIEHETS